MELDTNTETLYRQYTATSRVIREVADRSTDPDAIFETIERECLKNISQRTKYVSIKWYKTAYEYVCEATGWDILTTFTDNTINTVNIPIIDMDVTYEA